MERTSSYCLLKLKEILFNDKYNMDKEFVYHQHGDTYCVEPYALIWQNDYYYLIELFQETNEIRHYRLDRFGHDADIRKAGDDHFVLQTKAKCSDGLVNWILRWEDKAKVLSPDYLVAMVKGKVQKMAAVYTE